MLPVPRRELLRQRRETGSIAPKPHGGGHPPAFDSHTSQSLAKEVDEDPDATLDELRERCGGSRSIQAVSTTVLKLGLTRTNMKRLRGRAPRGQEDLVDAIAKALRSVTPSDAPGWFTSCGYRYTQS